MKQHCVLKTEHLLQMVTNCYEKIESDYQESVENGEEAWVINYAFSAKSTKTEEGGFQMKEENG